MGSLLVRLARVFALIAICSEGIWAGQSFGTREGSSMLLHDEQGGVFAEPSSAVPFPIFLRLHKVGSEVKPSQVNQLFPRSSLTLSSFAVVSTAVVETMDGENNRTLTAASDIS
jgi:hypothetical protein